MCRTEDFLNKKTEVKHKNQRKHELFIPSFTKFRTIQMLFWIKELAKSFTELVQKLYKIQIMFCRKGTIRHSQANVQDSISTYKTSEEILDTTIRHKEYAAKMIHKQSYNNEGLRNQAYYNSNLEKRYHNDVNVMFRNDLKTSKVKRADRNLEMSFFGQLMSTDRLRPCSSVRNITVNMLPSQEIKFKQLTEHVYGLNWAVYESETMRVASFLCYPLSAAKSSLLLANTGFVYIGNGTNDKVKCFFCLAEKENWDAQENIDEVHLSLNPLCPMVKIHSISNMASNGWPEEAEGTTLLSGAAATFDYSETEAAQTKSREDDTENITSFITTSGTSTDDILTSLQSELPASNMGSVSWFTDTVARDTEAQQTESRDRNNLQNAYTNTARNAEEQQPEVNNINNVQTVLNSQGRNITDYIIDQHGRNSQQTALDDRESYITEVITNQQGVSSLQRIRNNPVRETPLPTLSQAVEVTSNIRRTEGSLEIALPSQDSTQTLDRPTRPSTIDTSENRQIYIKRESNFANETNRNTNTSDLPSEPSRSHHPVINSQIYSIPTTRRVTSDLTSSTDATNTSSSGPGRQNTARYTTELNYQDLGIFYEKPKQPQYAILHKRISLFQDWTESETVKVDDLAKSGLYYAGYGDCCRCYFCGGGLRNWVDGDNPFVEHARWYPHCRYIRHCMGKEFIAAVDDLKSRGGTITIKDVEDYMKQKGQVFTTMFDDPQITKDTAVQALLQAGYKENDVIDAALSLRQNEVLLSVDVLLQNLRKVPAENSQAAASAESTPDDENIQDMKDQNYKLRRNMLCKICMDKEVGIVFLPCGHFTSCQECALALEDCPVCRGHIRGSVRAKFY